ncbi:DUF4339 domain-containing protein [Flavobacterium sp.]|jgi:hypothetical protein|uniref:DUF4339 domain-containing protein n=1 Tax=Flavobacterium sp. TaxID=239 RepID=UPI0037BE7484
MNTEWFYEKDGKNYGPVLKAEIEKLYADGEIDQLTLVWKKGDQSGDWKKISEWDEFNFRSVDTPPLKPIKYVLLNPYILSITFLPIWGELITQFIAGFAEGCCGYSYSTVHESFLWAFMFVIVNAVGSMKDEDSLNNSLGSKVKTQWWMGSILVPVYIYLRGQRLLRHYPKSSFIEIHWLLISWILSFLISVFILQ